MTKEQDAHLLAALDLQLAAIGPLLARVEALATDLAAAAPVEWAGPAEQAYRVATHVVGATVAVAGSALRNAIGQTGAAMRSVEARA